MKCTLEKCESSFLATIYLVLIENFVRSNEVVIISTAFWIRLVIGPMLPTNWNIKKNKNAKIIILDIKHQIYLNFETKQIK